MPLSSKRDWNSSKLSVETTKGEDYLGTRQEK
jgi:hypothetical protein